MVRNKTEEFGNTAVADEPVSDEKDDRRQANGAGDDARLSKGKDDDPQTKGADDDSRQANGTGDDRDTASGRRDANDLKQSQDVAGIEHQPDYKDIVATRLTEDHPKTAEAFREGRIMDYSSDRNLAGIRGGKMETEVRHVVGAVTEVSKGASDQERWQISAAAADQMLARQSIADDKREAQAAYSGGGGAQNQYQSVFEKMTDRQQGQLSWYKQQIVTFTDKAADPAYPKYTEKEAAKDIRRMMRDANQFLIQEKVIDKKGKLLTGDAQQAGNTQQNTDNRQAGGAQQNGNTQQNTDNRQAGGAQQNTGNTQAAGNEQNTGNTQAAGNEQNTGNTQATDNKQATGNRQNDYNSQKSQEIYEAMTGILNGKRTPEQEQELTKNFIRILTGNPTDDPKDRYQNAVYEATVANYRDSVINNFTNDKAAYQNDQNSLAEAGYLSGVIQGERFTVTVNEENFAQYGTDGARMQYLRQMAGDPKDSTQAQLQHTLLDNIAERVKEGTNDYEQVSTYAATVMGIQSLRDQQQDSKAVYDAFAHCESNGFDPAALKDITPSYIERAVMFGQPDPKPSPATDATVAALTPMAYYAMAQGKGEGLEAVKEQALAEFQYLTDNGIVAGLPADPKFTGSQDNVTAAVDSAKAIIEEYKLDASAGQGHLVNTVEPGRITVLQLARDVEQECSQHLAAGQFDLPEELQMKATYMMKGYNGQGGGNKE